MRLSIFLACAAATVAIAGSTARAGEAASAKAALAKPSARDWTRVVRPTPSGGFVMGNPNAKVKLVEFGSMTCPHCRAFDEEGVPHLLAFVKSGELSWEFRNHVRDAFDLSAALIARCDGARSFFPLARAIFRAQPAWEAKIQKAPESQLKAIQGLPAAKEFLALARLSGLQQLAAARGLPVAKSNQCLTNERSVKQLVQMTGAAMEQFPDFPGTPTFLINGTMVERAATWDALEPQLKKALAERG